MDSKHVFDFTSDLIEAEYVMMAANQVTTNQPIKESLVVGIDLADGPDFTYCCGETIPNNCKE